MIHHIQKPVFDLNALEPHIDAATMDLHVNKHHQGYADKLNALLDTAEARSLKLEEKNLEEILTSNFQLPTSQTIKNMAGGVLNHNFFWSILSPKSSEPSAAISEALNASFGNFDTFKTQFTESATKLFGSGWTWLVTNQQAPNSPLEIINLPNQENPIAHNKTVLLGIDLWEHAYYLKYQNRRPEYIDAFWNIVNWDQVNTIYQSLQ